PRAAQLPEPSEAPPSYTAGSVSGSSGAPPDSVSASTLGSSTSCTAPSCSAGSCAFLGSDMPHTVRPWGGFRQAQPATGSTRGGAQERLDRVGRVVDAAVRSCLGTQHGEPFPHRGRVRDRVDRETDRFGADLGGGQVDADAQLGELVGVRELV